MNPERIRVLVVDDHPVVREGLRAVLELSADCQVVEEARDGHDAIEAYARVRPNVAIVDIRLPLLGGIEAIRAIRRQDPQARLIALTSYGGDAEMRRALDAGASGLLLKGATGDEVVQAVRDVAAGRTHICPAASKELQAGSGTPGLTRRETEVLELVAEGLRNGEIAAELGLSLATVKVHVNHILAKLDAVDRTEAVTRALKRGLIALS